MDADIRPLIRRYTRALEEHVALLEQFLAEKGVGRDEIERWLDSRRTSQLAPYSLPESAPAPYFAGAKDRPPVNNPDTHDDGVDVDIDSDVRDTNEGDAHDGDALDGDALDKVVRMFSVGQSEGAAYVGPSSGLSLAMNLGEIVQASVWKHAIPETQYDETTPDTMDLMPEKPDGRPSSSASGSKHLRPMTIDELVRHSVKAPPSDALGSRLIDTYFRQLHRRYPFLNSVEIRKLHDERMDLTAGAIKHMSMARRYGIFKLYMVYAMGATLLQLVEKKAAISPEVRLSSGRILPRMKHQDETDLGAELLYDSTAAYRRGQGTTKHQEHRSHGPLSHLSSTICLSTGPMVHDRSSHEIVY